MTGTLRKLGVLLVAAVLGAAFAAGSSTSTTMNNVRTAPASGLVAQALNTTKVTLLTAEPGTSGAKRIVSAPASRFMSGKVTKNIGNARFATLSVGGHAAVFAVTSTSTPQNPAFAVTDVPGSVAKGSASLSVLSTYLYNAVHGTEPAVLLQRGSGRSAVTFAVYDPAKPGNGLPATGATQVTTFLNGHASRYKVTANGQGVQNLVIASGRHKGQQLGAVIG